MSLDAAVFLFGVLVSTVAGSGILVLFYGYPYLEEAEHQNLELGPKTKWLARFVFGDRPS